MKFFATLALVASVAVAQQVGSDSGPTVADGPSAVSNPNINNGQQAQNSLVDGSNKGGNTFSGLKGNTFTNSASNFGMSDNNVVNPSQTVVSGNTGPSANGEDNQIGDILAEVRRRALTRRDAILVANAMLYLTTSHTRLPGDTLPLSLSLLPLLDFPSTRPTVAPFLAPM
ncbi:hypothetical protein H4R24_005051 [Coemansia sp. RSA 988]|nr:hypothetical protein H4R24_005051 [Coemansia sp. RSA 988]